MLPFLKPKTIPGLIIAKRKPDGGQTAPQMEGEENQGLELCAEDLIRAIHAKDAKGVASALRAISECIDESSDSDSNDYDSQNEKAAKDAQE